MNSEGEDDGAAEESKALPLLKPLTPVKVTLAHLKEGNVDDDNQMDEQVTKKLSDSLSMHASFFKYDKHEHIACAKTS